jgi:hypothetical protein
MPSSITVVSVIGFRCLNPIPFRDLAMAASVAARRSLRLISPPETRHPSQEPEDMNLLLLARQICG